MKLATLTNLNEIEQYAKSNGFRSLCVTTTEKKPLDIAAMLNRCFTRALEQGCVEFCIEEIFQDYDFALDLPVFHVSIIGFIPKVKTDKQ